MTATAAAPAGASGSAPWRVPLTDVAVDDAIVAAVERTVRSGWWSTGPRVAEFERRFADFCGVEHAIAVANGTAALHLALLAVGCGPGDDVLLPSLNFVAAANAILHTGATPVFCDIGGPDDLNVSADDLEAAIGPATKCVVVMHYGGHPCRMAEILACAARHGLVVLEDAAHAPGARWQDRPCGTIGTIGCFSFFSNKNLATGEGGMVVTHDADLAARLKLLRSHGMTAVTWDRHRGHAHAYDVVTDGFNYRLDELRASIGLVQLDRLLEQNERRARIVAVYRDALDGVNGLSMPFRDDGDRSLASHHLAVVVLPETCARDDFRTRLAADGMQTSVHYPPIHRFSRYRDEPGVRCLPATDAVADRLVTLPLYPHMQEWQVALVIEACRAASGPKPAARAARAGA